MKIESCEKIADEGEEVAGEVLEHGFLLERSSEV